MSSMGVFRKVEVDEKSYWVYTLSQTDDPTSSGEEAKSMNSGGENLPLQPLFVCPTARIKFQESKQEKDEDGDDLYDNLPFDSSPRFLITRSGDEQGGSLLDCGLGNICKLPVVPLFWCNNKEPHDKGFECGACHVSMFSTSYYACLECDKMFHKECVESPLEIIHPSHPFHSLQLCSHSEHILECSCCATFLENMVYHCSSCEVTIHPICAMKPVPFFVDHPKSHPHPLTFFPTQASLVCHICGLIKNSDPTYICIQCVFVIHKGCIGFPHVIRICRHPHRISFTSSLPSGKLSCGVCRQQVDNNYGAYSCNICDAYFVHSKCAIDKRVWDGKDLDGVPEEDDLIDDGEPFERMADGIILHPFHCHNLRLEISRVYDENKYCRGCTLPIYEGEFYSCMECDFILHESCANCPRMKRNLLHPHPLTLNFATKGPNNKEGTFRCSACGRIGTGFFYEYYTGEYSFQLDLRCASITEPFVYQGHKHPLYLASDPNGKPRCHMCEFERYILKLDCIECDYIICFSCATFPYKARYKHDSHFLTICDGKEASDQPDWCDVCECKIEEKKKRDYLRNQRIELRFYKCNDCCTTLHVECLLGIDMYMKPGNTIKDYISVSKCISGKREIGWADVKILLNKSLCRPICTECMRRCPFPIVFEGYNDNTIFCTLGCIKGYNTSNKIENG